ncbi:MAG TPA: hypothetical protein VEX68_07975 [Bryobacteraceae bacterium]|nr:hypothetical protein [Bryobacteraceae bacterium]
MLRSCGAAIAGFWIEFSQLLSRRVSLPGAVNQLKALLNLPQKTVMCAKARSIRLRSRLALLGLTGGVCMALLVFHFLRSMLLAEDGRSNAVLRYPAAGFAR